jgi:hypothetical protein
VDREIAILSLSFIGLLVAKVIIENPTELMGWKGVLIVSSVVIASLVLLAKRLLINFLKDIRWMLGRKTFHPLSFYGIKNVEIKDDWIKANISKGTVGYTILRVEQAALPYLYKERDIEEEFYKPYLRVVQGIDFKIYMVIKSSRFDVTDFLLRLNEHAAKSNPDRSKRLKKVMDRVYFLSKYGKEKRILIVIPSNTKNLRSDLQTKASQVQSLLIKNLGLDSEFLTASEIVCEFQKFIDPDVDFSAVGTEQISNLSLSSTGLLHVDKVRMFNNGIFLENESEITVNQFFRIKDHFSDPTFDWLPRLLDTSQDLSYDLVIEVSPLPLSETLSVLDGEIRRLKISIKAVELRDKIPKQSTLEKLRELERFQRLLVEGKQKPMKMDVYGRVFGTMKKKKEGEDE